MKIKLTVGAAMLLTLGSALAGGLILQKDKSPEVGGRVELSISYGATQQVTPEMIAKWKVTAATADHTPPMLPI